MTRKLYKLPKVSLGEPHTPPLSPMHNSSYLIHNLFSVRGDYCLPDILTNNGVSGENVQGINLNYKGPLRVTLTHHTRNGR